VIVITRDDDYFLGVLHSHLHELWAVRMGGRHGIGNDLTYNNSVCFETFPFPWPPGKEPSKTAASLRGASFATKQSLSDETEIASHALSAHSAGARLAKTLAMTEIAKERAIADAARELVQLRETQSGNRTLTQLYNERPTWLDNAHQKLDAAVFAAYGWPVDLSDDEILARLLALNLERARHDH
jgi:type II restriction/modification system DNA methylase subunit YeeA